MKKRSSIVSELDSHGIQFTHGPDECIGFHGTSRKYADNILKGGFNPSMANPEAWFGPAFYFYDNANFAASKSAIYWAINGYHRFRDAAVVEADLRFSLLLDLTEAKNGRNYWKLKNLLQNRGEDVEEQDLCRLIGTMIAVEMNSEGVAFDFPVQGPRERGSQQPRRQRGFAVRLEKQKVIVNIRRYSKNGEERP